MNRALFRNNLLNPPNLSRNNRKFDPSKDIDREKLNPATFFKVAYLLEPLFRSAMIIHSWSLYFFIRLFKVKFSLYKLAQESLFVLFLKVDVQNRRTVYSLFFLQLVLFTTALLYFVNTFISRGTTLSKKLLHDTNLQGQVALVTGGYTGIGYETTLQLLKWKCKVVIFGKNKNMGAEALKQLKKTASFDESNLSFIQCDLDDLKSVKQAVDQFLNENDRLDLLVNNAGVYTKNGETTKLGLECNFSTNFLGHFYLTNLLLDVLKKSQARVINVSSIAHYRYNPKDDKIFETKSTTDLEKGLLNTYYGRSKLFVIWFTHALQQKMIDEKCSVMCFSLHPGIIKTKMCWPIRGRSKCMIPRVLVPLILKRPVDGAATTLHLCASDYKNLIPGAYYADCNIGVVSTYSHDREREEKLWKLGEEFVQKYSK